MIIIKLMIVGVMVVGLIPMCRTLHNTMKAITYLIRVKDVNLDHCKTIGTLIGSLGLDVMLMLVIYPGILYTLFLYDSSIGVPDNDVMIFTIYYTVLVGMIFLLCESLYFSISKMSSKSVQYRKEAKRTLVFTRVISLYTLVATTLVVIYY